MDAAGMERQTLTPPLGVVRAWLDGVVGAFPSKAPFIYHRGHLALDRESLVMGEDGNWKLVVCVEVDAGARLMWEAEARGEVVLTQKRIGTSDYLYQAQRSMKWRSKR